MGIREIMKIKRSGKTLKKLDKNVAGSQKPTIGMVSSAPQMESDKFLPVKAHPFVFRSRLCVTWRRQNGGHKQCLLGQTVIFP